MLTAKNPNNFLFPKQAMKEDEFERLGSFIKEAINDKVALPSE